MEIKIECPCGHHFAFDVEPVNGQMPCAIACPSCNDDATAMANSLIAAQVIIPAKPAAPRLAVNREAHPAPSAPPAVPTGIQRDARSLGLVSREQAESEAQAKISWGEEPDAVIRYLMLQSFPADEAKELVDGYVLQRLADVRKNGIRMTIIVASLAFGVGALFFLCYKVGFTSPFVMGLMGLSIVFGLWKMVNGILMIAAPKMQSGDVAED
jgi:hypothetical protein